MAALGLALTPRDTELLHDCYRNVQLSFAQIQARHFAGRSRPTVANRIAALKREGLLTVHRIGTVVYQHRGRGVGAVYQVTRRGLRRLEAFYPDEHFREGPVPLNQASLVHDLILTDAITALMRIRPGWRVTHGRLVDGPGGHRVPDAVVEGPSGEGKVAIELELTPKSERRYRQIILQYRTDSRYQKVLYVVAGKGVEGKLRYLIAGRRQVPGLPVPDTGKFEFMSLKILLQAETQADRSLQTPA